MENVWILYLTLPVCAGVVNIFPHYPGLIHSQTSINFVYYPQKIPWSSARAVCQSLGGDLATVDSDEVRDYIVWRAQENYGTNIFIEEYWVGLVQLKENERFWVADCTNLTFTANFMEDFDPNKNCFRHKHDHNGNRRDCTNDDAFLCQVPSSEPCDFISHTDSEILAVELGMVECYSECLKDPECWAAVKYVPDNCIKLALPGYGVDRFKMASKFCFNVTLNETIITPDISHSTLTPNATCGNFLAAINPSPTNTSLMTSLMLPFCDTLTLTETKTEVSTDTETEISTSTKTEIATSISTEISTDTTTELSTSTKTETDTTTETKTVISTVTTTEISTETTTEISTDTTTGISTDTTTETTIGISSSTTIDISTSTVTSTVVARYTQNNTLEKAEEVAAEIAKNLTIDPKTTSSQIRRLTSAEDKRKSSKFVGCIGIILVTAPLILMIISDVRKFLEFRKHGNRNNKGKAKDLTIKI